MNYGTEKSSAESTSKDSDDAEVIRQPYPSWTNPHPIQTGEPVEYYIGDIYDRFEALEQGRWPQHEIDDGPYLRRIKHLARNGWPQLRYLADFMDCGTVPIKRRMLVPEDESERKNRLHVVVIDSQPGAPLSVQHFHNATRLEEFLDECPWPDAQGYVRLFVVEDLSTVCIELLGSRFGLDPSFFRAHISDYSWYNLRDPWYEQPVLPSRAAESAHFTLRHLRPHYFPDQQSKEAAQLQTGGFNVLRRIDFDASAAMGWADRANSFVGSIRSSTSVYIRPRSEAGQGWLGILLVDPPVRSGYPLWGGYDNIRPPAAVSEQDILKPHLFKSPLEDFVYWTTSMPMDDLLRIRMHNDLILAPIFCSIPSQWLTSFEHITGRLSLIEWTVEREATKTAEGLNAALQRLHPWRRNVVNFSSRIRASIDLIQHRFGDRTDGSETEWKKYIANFECLEDRCRILEAKIDKIMSVLTAVIAIAESKSAIENGRDVGRITYLAFIYVPISFVASFLSMDRDWPAGGNAVYWGFFCVAIPITTMSLCLAIYWPQLMSIWDRRKRRRAADGQGSSLGKKLTKMA